MSIRPRDNESHFSKELTVCVELPVREWIRFRVVFETLMRGIYEEIRAVLGRHEDRPHSLSVSFRDHTYRPVELIREIVLLT